MDAKHIILETDSISKMQELLNANAQNGYKAVSLTPYFDNNSGVAHYTALMVQCGDSGTDLNFK